MKTLLAQSRQQCHPAGSYSFNLNAVADSDASEADVWDNDQLTVRDLASHESFDSTYGISFSASGPDLSVSMTMTGHDQSSQAHNATLTQVTDTGSRSSDSTHSFVITIGNTTTADYATDSSSEGWGFTRHLDSSGNTTGVDVSNYSRTKNGSQTDQNGTGYNWSSSSSASGTTITTTGTETGLGDNAGWNYTYTD